MNAPRPRLVFLVLLVLGCFPVSSWAQEQPATNVFQLPQLQLEFVRLQREIQELGKKSDWKTIEAKCREFLVRSPAVAAVHYDLACALARQSRSDDSLASLAKAVELGYLDVKHIQEDPDLESLRANDKFKALIEKTKEKIAKLPLPGPPKIPPALAKDGAVEITGKNTAYDPRVGLFLAFIQAPKPEKPARIIGWEGEAAALLKKWFEEGTAAGNIGDFYDNHDQGHSSMDLGSFPQLTRIVFSDDVKKANLHHGLQLRLLYTGVVIGNSSTALVGTPFWRSQPRAALTLDPLGAALLANQYEHNHLYFYPEHQDYDPGHNNQGGGYGDVYPANTPYVVISQGSSGSDRPFMDAVAATLAAFRPDTKQFLVQNGALMPTVQMILRRSYRGVTNNEEYLTGRAHPAVFQGSSLNVVEMVKLAHQIEKNSTPPVVRIKVVEEDLGEVGRDYCDAGPRERLFDTPGAIARIFRSTQYSKKMVVSTEGSRDLNGKPLRFQWKVLQGDASKIKITPRNPEGTIAEVVIPYLPRGPISPGHAIESNRVDIGVFAFNGQYLSAPAFLSISTLDCEKRVYDDKQRLTLLDTTDPSVKDNYVDPVLATPGRWRDEFHYDAQNRRTGWTRQRDGKKEEFTADGHLVEKTDDRGRALQARRVAYVVQQQPGQVPLLVQQTTAELVTYTYDSPEDRVGHASPAKP